MPTDTTNQAAWIAYDNARANGATDREAMLARAMVQAAHLRAPIEGPAEAPASFGARSTARLFGVLS